MEGDDDFGVPAGWYPDPLGLPQLRWWDGQSWTEFTSEAQAPVMMQPSPVLPEPAMAAASTPATAAPTEATFVGMSDDGAGVAAAAAALIEVTSTGGSVYSVAEPAVAEPVVAAAAAYVQPAEPVAAESVVNVHNLGEQMQFMTRRERRDYERRLEAEAAMFPHTIDPSVAPAAYIQEPVVPEFVQAAAASIIVEPVVTAAPTQPLQPEPLQPQPMTQESFAPYGQTFGPDTTVPPTSFADLLHPDRGVGEPATVQSGALAIPNDPPPFFASGLRELEPALAEILAEAALAPRLTTVPATELPSGFVIDEVVVEDEPAPRRTVTAKRTYTPAAWILAVSPLIQVAFAYLVVFVLNQPTNRAVMAVIWFGGLAIAAGIAGYDRLLLKASGHERPAAGWWALLTPFVYLLVRWSRTRPETGKGALVFLFWVLAAAIAGGVIYLNPILFTAAIQ